MNASYAVRALNPAHPDLANAAGVPARLANEKYIESLARIVYYWAYPAVDAFGRTSSWDVMKAAGPGATMGLFPGAPKNMMGYLDDHMSSAQRKVVTPNATPSTAPASPISPTDRSWSRHPATHPQDTTGRSRSATCLPP
ncbi:hypothetical protein WKW79_00325 [Variovorax robiniae]|uniref:Uncharacterized protein n=1 Tax=Variovorax robiniae TaxID=1836199 RepID=A0ABU8WZL2_9BURK